MTTYLNIPYTLTLAASGDTTHIVAELDCELEVTFDDLDNWGIDAVIFSKSLYNPAFTVTPKSDPDLWKLLERTLERDSTSIADKVMEAAIEERMDRLAARADYERDIQMGH